MSIRRLTTRLIGWLRCIADKRIMARTTQEWIGDTPDTPIPMRVKLRVFQQANGHCQKCTRKLQPGHWECDHAIAIINGGENRESNLQVLCDVPCHSGKTKQDVKIKAKTYKTKTHHLGMRKPKQPFRGWRKMDGTIVWNKKS